MISMLTSAGRFAAAIASAAGLRINLKMTIQMPMIMNWIINAAIALSRCVSFVTPQNWKCQEWIRGQKMRDDPAAAKEDVGLIPKLILTLQQIYPKMLARIVWPMAAPG